MIPTKNLSRTALCLILFLTAFTITLTDATTENNYKTDNNFLTNISESTHTENGYKTNIIINPTIVGIYANENGYKLDLSINTQGIGGSLKENNYKLDLTPEKTFPDSYTLTITTTIGGTTNPSPGPYRYPSETIVTVSATPSANYVFDHWEIDGSLIYLNPIAVTMNSDHTLRAVFSYQVTIEAYCLSYGAYVNVNIIMDGSPTGYTTPHTFTGLVGTHTITVPDKDALGHPFIVWSIWWVTSTTITVEPGKTYIAFYRIESGASGCCYGCGRTSDLVMK